MAASYRSFEHGLGIGISYRGSASLSACSARTQAGVSWTATRPTVSVTVVNMPRTSKWPCCCKTCRAHAESLPVDLDIRIGVRLTQTKVAATHPRVPNRWMGGPGPPDSARPSWRPPVESVAKTRT